MILVDTSVISEVMKPAPSAAILSWLNHQRFQTLFISAITIGEIECGLRIPPDGSLRSRLKDRFERFVSLAFAQRVLACEERAARAYGEIMGLRRQIGRPMSIPDGHIAEIARAHRLSVA